MNISWAEIEYSAERFDSIINPSVPTLSPKIPTTQEAVNTITAEKQAEVDQVFEKFKVRECLEAIGRDVWHEGSVNLNGCIFGPTLFGLPEDSHLAVVLSNHLYLVSDKFTEITPLWRNGPIQKSSLFIQSGSSSINVSVEPNRSRDYDMDTIEVSTHSIYDLSDSPVRSRHSRGNFLERYWADQSLRNRQRPSGVEWRVNIYQSDAEGAFHSALKKIVDEIVKANCLPSQIRDWCNHQLEPLPQDWKNTGNKRIEFPELLNWYYQIKDTPQRLRRINERLGYRLPI